MLSKAVIFRDPVPLQEIETGALSSDLIFHLLTEDGRKGGGGGGGGPECILYNHSDFSPPPFQPVASSTRVFPSRQQ